MAQHARDTLAALGLRLADALHALTEELRECRKEHTALRQQVERIQEAVSSAAGHPPTRREPSPVAALRTRYSELFDAGEFRQAPGVYAEVLAAEAQVCGCGHVSRHHDPEHGGCRVCPCPSFVASQLPENAS
mgnify:CR=1 FL=1